MDVAGSAPQGLTTMRTLFTCFLNWEYRRGHEVYGTRSQAYTNSIPDKHPLCPDGQHTLAFYINCVPLAGQRGVEEEEEEEEEIGFIYEENHKFSADDKM